MNTLYPSSWTRRLEELTADETARLIVLNDQMVAAETWIHERTRQSLSAYYAAGGVKGRRLNNKLIEDVEIEAKVTCVLRAGHPEFRKGADNIVAELDALALPAEASEESFPFSIFGAEGEQRPLVDRWVCGLFYDLIDHVLLRDWDRALDIGEIWIDVKLVQQRIVTW